jgi:hypothetical protein
MALIPQPNPSTFTEGICSGYTPVSEIFTFNVECQSTRSSNQHLQLAWLNRYGHWDYYSMLFNRFQGLNIERQVFKQWNTDWGSNNPVKTQYSRGTTDAEVVMVETVVINSGFVNQPTFQWLEDLWTSNDVYEIQTNGGLAAINILNTEFEKKIEGNRTVYNIELQYVYSNNIVLLGR